MKTYKEFSNSVPMHRQLNLAGIGGIQTSCLFLSGFVLCNGVHTLNRGTMILGILLFAAGFVFGMWYDRFYYKICMRYGNYEVVKPL